MKVGDTVQYKDDPGREQAGWSAVRKAGEWTGGTIARMFTITEGMDIAVVDWPNGERHRIHTKNLEVV